MRVNPALIYRTTWKHETCDGCPFGPPMESPICVGFADTC